MNIKNKIVTIAGIFLLFNNSSLAAFAVTAATTETTSNNNQDTEVTKIIEDFAKYASKIPAEIREEVKNYRIEIAKINQQKRELYKRISQEAQKYLAEEQSYKKKLGKINKENIKSPVTNAVINNDNPNKPK